MTPQRPVGSGFGHDSTATEVLAGIDLTGRTVVLTGGYSGIGLEATRALTAAGAHVVVPARRPERAAAELAGIERTEVAELDLGDQDSVARFAQEFLASGRPIHAFIGNAGIMACPETRLARGWEAQFGTNHLGHYALVNRLWPALAAGGGRVVSLSSSAHHRSGIRFEDPMFTRGDYDKWEAYGQAKTANALFALHLDTLAAPQGVRTFSMHPGGILTPLQRHLPREEMVAAGWIDEDGNELMEGFKTPAAGAATEVWAATSPRLDGLGGVFCEDCDIALPVDADRPPFTAGVAPHATDPEAAARLWALSAELTGVDAFA
ncbi:SDR family NAD(P)-dependent oxidoreductase [Kineococcus rhizosphaerae]|uniref:Probable oxidoreductase n=1 Tax=Kineococcus rhizosphaerae TaxID=559628 RepID=A0A2T0QZ39_9ACTN|nr:SDR family NAD(P)-dependent oxidoreductase [Kineococcus rhizosphaerae]PRY11787.1 NAD(P)-dependent dehydrogenase (short-subunit alcohol dehydrogenase family) [Kineococcus rhizosphaerae]